MLDARERQASRLEGADARRDHHGAGDEARTGGGGDVEFAVGLGLQLGHFLAEMERGVKRLRLFHQPVDQFLSPADGQRRDVVDRLVRIQLGALAAHLRQGIDDVRCRCREAPARRSGTSPRGRRR